MTASPSSQSCFKCVYEEPIENIIPSKPNFRTLFFESKIIYSIIKKQYPERFASYEDYVINEFNKIYQEMKEITAKSKQDAREKLSLVSSTSQETTTYQEYVFDEDDVYV
jgi:hypothetical protein